MSTAVNIGSNVTRGRYQLALLSSCHLHKMLIRVTRADSELVKEMHEVLKVAPSRRAGMSDRDGH